MKKLLSFLVKISFIIFLSPLLWWHRRPFRLHERGKYVQALAAYQRRIDWGGMDGSSAGYVYFNMGLIYKVSGSEPMARRYFGKARYRGVNLNPDDYPGNQPAKPILR